MPALNIKYLVFFSIGQIVAFSVCFFLLGKRDTSVKAWLLSNVIGIAGILLIGNPGGAGYRLAAFGGSLTILSGILKAVALASGQLHFKRYRFANILLVISLVSAVLLSVVINTPYRMLVVVIGMCASAAACLVCLLKNRRWLGLRPTGPLALVLALATLGAFAKIGNAYPFGVQTMMVEQNQVGAYNFLLICALSMLMQFIFLSLILAQNARSRQTLLNRERRLYSAARVNIAMLRETAAIAEERQNLIKMLTHEVRQPLNTAQAALQSIATDVGALRVKDFGIKAKLSNTLTVLNAITLSISNSLIGATLISQRRKPQLESINICDVSQLAYLDIGATDLPRITLQFAQPYIFTDADPIVLRLALRNLLENAVKYSPADTPITFKIGADEDRLTLYFSVTNQIIDKAMLNGDIFARNKRGADSRYGGDGLGLFIVNEVAAMHEGALSYNIAGDEVTFQLEIPA